MRTVITLNKNRQEAPTEKDQGSTSQNLFPKSAGQPVIQVKQNRPNQQHQPYSAQEHATVPFTGWSDDSHTLQPAEEDMYDPDLAINYAGTRGYMLQPG